MRSLARLLVSVVAFGLLAGSSAYAAKPDWKTLHLSSAPTAREVARYLRDLRLLANTPQPAGAASAEGVEAKIDGALVPITAEHVELLLKECVRAEDDAPAQLVDVHTDSGELIGYDWIKPELRTVFTRRALVHIVALPNIPASQRKAIFQSLDVLPELVGIVRLRSWESEAAGVVSADLIRKINVHGWHGAATAWIDYLLHLHTPAAMAALDYMLIRAVPAVKRETYFAMKKLSPPPIDVDATVARAWSETKSHATGHESYATIALQYGHLDALVDLANYVEGKTATPDERQRFGRFILTWLDWQEGREEAAAAYVLANKAALRFDPKGRKYVAMNRP